MGSWRDLTSMSDSTFCPLVNIAVPTSFVSRINILPSRLPCAMIFPSSSMKHPRWMNWTCIPWSTIFPTNTKFLVIVETCRTFLSGRHGSAERFWCLRWDEGCHPRLPTTPGCSGFSKVENHSLWFVMWLDASESTCHSSFSFEVLIFIELALCFITKARVVSAPPEPLA